MNDRPMAVCRVDGEPLVSALDVPGFEWLCMVCGARFTYFGCGSATPTPALDARYAELREQQRQQREAAKS